MMAFDRVLKELQSFLLSKFDLDPKRLVLMFLPRCLQVPCEARCSQIDRVKISVFFDEKIQKLKKNYCLTVAQVLTFRNQS